MGNLSIKLYRIYYVRGISRYIKIYHVIRGVWYYPQFHAIAVGLGTYYPWIRGSVCVCILTYLLTYSTVQSPSLLANWSAASQEIPRISRNPKVHYRTHKQPPPISILGQPNPVHIPTSHLVEIHPNIIHPSTPRSPQWSPSLRFPQQDPIHNPFFTHTCLCVYTYIYI